MNDYHYFSLTKKYLISTLDVFNKISIRYMNTNGEIKSIEPNIILPFQDKRYMMYNSFLYNKNKAINKLDLTDKQVTLAKVLPVISMYDITYTMNNNIKLNKYNKLQNNLSFNKPISTNTPVYYDISFNIAIITKKMETNLQYIEQLIPKFTPVYSYRISNVTKIVEDLNINLKLESISPTIDTEFDEMSERQFITELNFTMSVPFYPNYYTDSELLKELIINE